MQLLMCCGWLPGCCCLVVFYSVVGSCHGVAIVVARVLLCGYLFLMCCGWWPECCYAVFLLLMCFKWMPC